MGPKILITGGTGYVGGSVLDTIITNHPEYDVTALLRNVPSTFASRYPNVRIVKGDYDSFDVLADAAAQADVVIRNGTSRHEGSVRALIAGLLRRPSPGFLIHLSGTGIVSDFRIESMLGKESPRIWSDLHDLEEISSLPDEALHRNTEKILNAAVAEHGDRINIAIMCPPNIYGRGSGPGRTKSVYIPILVEEAKMLGGKVFYYGDGANTTSAVHIDDLMRLYLKVVEAAVAGGGNATWNKEGYYFASTQEFKQLDVAKASGEILKRYGIIENAEPTQVSLEQLDNMYARSGHKGLCRYIFASNSRTRAERAEKLFGYQGQAPSLFEALEEDIKDVILQG